MTGRVFATWLLSAVGGAAIGLPILTLGVRGLLALVALCIVAARFAPPALAIGGVLVGCGAVVVFAIASAEARCAGAGEGSGACFAATGNGLGFVPALGVLLTGCLLTLRRMRAA